MEPNNALQEGLEKLRQGQFDEAAQLLHAAVKAEPKNAQAHAYLGVLLCQRKEYREAILELSKARRLDPSSAPIAYNLGTAHHAAGHIAQAETAYEAALKLDPSHQKAKAALDQLAAQQTATAQAEAAPVGAPGDVAILECPLCKSPSQPGAARCGVCGADYTPILRKYVLRQTMMTGQTVYVCANCKTLIPDIRVPVCPNCSMDFGTGTLPRHAAAAIAMGQPLTHIRPGEVVGRDMSWEYASFTRRLVAWIIDSVLLGIVAGLVFFPTILIPMMKELNRNQPRPAPSAAAHIVQVQMQTPPTPAYPGQPGVPGYPGTQALPPGFAKMIPAAMKAVWFIALIVGAYYTLLIGIVGRTVGMMALGIRCQRPDGSRVGIPRAFLRWLVSLNQALIYTGLRRAVAPVLVRMAYTPGQPPAAMIPALLISIAILVVSYIGYLWMIWALRNRTWHDMAADTVVVVG